ncbi:HAMP domain-containing histidine kinase [bacterium]|nr:HAMP domain-containing histidine kinase [bacterium]
MTDPRRIVEFFDVLHVDEREHEFPAEIRAALSKINRMVAAQESMSSLMDFLFDATIGICPCNRITLSFIADEGRRMVIRWSRGDGAVPGRELAGFATDIHRATQRGVLAKNKVRLIHDLPEFLRLNPQSTSARLFVELGYRSSMTCPLYSADQLIGVLMRHAVAGHAFSEDHVAQHLATGERLAQAVAQAQRLAEIEELNQSYMEMLGFVSHELKSPLSSVIMTNKLLLDEYFGELTDKQEQKIAATQNKVEYLLNLVREYLDLARLEGGNLELHARPVDDFVAGVVQPALEIVEAQLAECGMQLDWTPPDGALAAEIDTDLLKIVLVNLLSNAVKYGNADGRIELSVSLDDGLLHVGVLNEGPGFPASELPRLFKKFSRLQTAELKSRKGTGVGLYTCWRIIHLHGGRIWAESEEGHWARFSFELPQPLKPATSG